MKKTSLIGILPVVFFSLFPLFHLKAQSIERSVISSTGNYSTGSSVSVSATVGEPVVPTYTSGSIILTQGFQQPENADSVTGVSEVQAVITWTLFPNPATTQTNLMLSEVPVNCTLHLYNLAGQLIMERKIAQQKVQHKEVIDLHGLASGTYMLSILSNRQLLANLPIQRVD
ncbi:MAG TPA: T9SS type A sorting domain-containing protein [Chitinophagales bacterium]|nr:T9SS type A sorting domain-containing protein [Chitinophagales bacterium]